MYRILHKLHSSKEGDMTREAHEKIYAIKIEPSNEVELIGAMIFLVGLKDV